MYYIRDPENQPHGLVYALYDHTTPMPLEPPVLASEETMQWQAESGAGNHCQVAQGHLPRVLGEQGPYLDSHRIASVLDIPQHGRDYHKGQADPEQDKEAPEISMVALSIEMRHTGSIFDGWK